MNKLDEFNNKLKEHILEKKVFDNNRHLELSKQNLIQNLKKKLNTIMIGAIAQFEKHFGKEWGYGKEDKDCGEQENSQFDIWEKCREEVLDLGNKQIRAAIKEIERYNVDLKGNTVKLPMRGK